MHKNINSANGQEKIEQETIPLDAESLGLVGSLPVGKEEVVASPYPSCWWMAQGARPSLESRCRN